MCSRYNLTSPPEAVRAYFKLDAIDPFPPRYNIAPTQPVGIVRLAEGGGREFALVRWGLIPSWAKDPAKLTTLINARIETVAEKPSFRGSVRHRRCLVPANGFYEWTGRPGAKQPHLIRPRDGGLMALAGLWEHWLGADGSEIQTMAIVTMPADPEVSAVHDRMPAIVPPDLFDGWLDTRNLNPEMAINLLRDAAPRALDIIAVHPRINSSRNEGPGLLEPLDQPLP